MNNFNKNHFVCFILFFLSVMRVAAQAAPTLEEQVNNYWKLGNYVELGALLDAKTSAAPPDIAALYCAKIFYVFIQPNKAKALLAVTKLKQVAETTGDSDFIAFANGELAEVQSVPDAEFDQGNVEVLSLFRNQSPNSFPNIEMGIRLRRFILRSSP